MTDVWLKKLRVEEGREEYADATTAGLRLRVSRKAKRWSVMVSRGGGRVRQALGTYPEMTLKEARLSAEKAKAGDFTFSTTNVDEKIIAATVREVVEAYVTRLEDEGRPSAKNYRNALLTGATAFAAFVERDDQLGPDASAADLTPGHVAGWLREAHARAPFYVRDLRTYVHAVFAWAAGAEHDPTVPAAEAPRFGLTSNPVAAVGKGKRRQAARATIPLDELRTFWLGLPDIAEPRTVLACRLIIAMGGQRLTEIAHSQKAWWRDGLSLPDTKAGKGTEAARPHWVPLPRLADEQHRMALSVASSRSPYLFPNAADVSQPMTIEMISKTVRAAREPLGLSAWKMAWLRATFKSAILGADPEFVIDGVRIDDLHMDVWQNHGRNADIARSAYDAAERRAIKQRVASAIDEFLGDVLAADRSREYLIAV